MNSFSDLIGNSSVKERLKQYIHREEIPSTMLFAGPSGVGKSLFARLFAKQAMNTTKNHPVDLIEIAPEGKSQIHSMSAFREMISNIYVKPHESQVKFYIIHQTHRMLPVHANALLKTLEEPPEHARIILLTSQKEDLLDTVLSRCVEIPFFEISLLEMEQHLEKKLNLEKEKIKEILPFLGGSFEHLSFYLQEGFEQFQVMFKQFIQAFFSQNYSTAFSQLEEIEKVITSSPVEDQQKYIDLFFEFLLFWYRDVFYFHQSANEHKLYFKDLTEHYAPLIAMQNLDMKKVYDHSLIARDALERNMRFKHVIEDFVLSTKDMINEEIQV